MSFEDFAQILNRAPNPQRNDSNVEGEGQTCPKVNCLTWLFTSKFDLINFVIVVLDPSVEILHKDGTISIVPEDIMVEEVTHPIYHLSDKKNSSTNQDLEQERKVNIELTFSVQRVNLMLKIYTDQLTPFHVDELNFHGSTIIAFAKKTYTPELNISNNHGDTLIYDTKNALEALKINKKFQINLRTRETHRKYLARVHEKNI
ncbi:hypothetical protein ACJX0J_034520 [Zea mays]